MKKLLIAGLLILTGAQSFAQDQEQQRELSDECKKFLSLEGTYGEQGMWRDAANFFIKAYAACGEENFDQTDWKNARAIYSELLKAEEDATRKEQLQDSVYMFFEKELEYFPTPKLAANYAAKLVRNKSTDTEKIDKLFGESIHTLKEKVSVNQVIYYYIHLIGKYNAAKGEEKDAARDFAIDEYLILSDYISAALKKYKDNEKAVKSYKKAQGYLDNYFSKLAKDCEMLTTVLGEKINELPADKEEKLAKINTYLKLLEKRACDKSDLYGQLADSALTLDPNASAYYSQGKYFMNRDEASKAVSYFKKAVEMEGEEGENIDSYNLSLANALLKTRSYRAAFSTAKKVQGEGRGKAMIICAASIGASANSCGDTTFDRKANFWLADDYMKKASALGEDYSSSYLKNAPTTTEVFEQGKSAGSSITLKCWGESTVIR